MRDTGFEQGQESSGKKLVDEQCGAESGADSPQIDADLLGVIEAWANLPEVIKAGILAMIRVTP
ncbi:MAG: hypothetical protein AAGD11_11215 [Planctomycetota bacterium]